MIIFQLKVEFAGDSKQKIEKHISKHRVSNWQEVDKEWRALATIDGKLRECFTCFSHSDLEYTLQCFKYLAQKLPRASFTVNIGDDPKFWLARNGSWRQVYAERGASLTECVELANAYDAVSCFETLPYYYEN